MKTKIVRDARWDVETIRTLSDGGLISESGNRMRIQMKSFVSTKSSTKKLSTLGRPRRILEKKLC